MLRDAAHVRPVKVHKEGQMVATAVEQDRQVAKDPMRFHVHYHRAKPPGDDGSPYAGGSSFMERVSEAVASGMGTVSFLIVSSAIILGWVLSNNGIQEPGIGDGG